MDTADTTPNPAENPDIQALRTIFADPILGDDMNRIGTHPDSILERLEELGKPDLITAVRQAFVAMLAMRREPVPPGHCFNPKTTERVRQVRDALRGIGF